MDKAIWIVAATRTPIGSFQGCLSPLSAPELGQYVIEGALSGAGASPELIDEVFMGCVLPAGCGQAPARQAALGAGIPAETGCTTINKVCGSGMKAVMLGHDLIKAGSINSVMAGGMESMTNAPYLLMKAREGMRLGHADVKDHMFLDGLEDAYDGQLMGVFAQQTADEYGITRPSMDEWALMSLQRANQAIASGQFIAEITPVTVKQKKESVTVSSDEQPSRVSEDKIPHLPPAFAKNGTVTAANSSSIADGAAALLLMDSDMARQQGLSPLAVIKGHATRSRKPSEFTIAPGFAIQALLEDVGWKSSDVDLWEINEAFAVVTQLAVKQLGLDISKVNVNGGACALGHPIGASGARILVTLIYALRQHGGKRGVASLCIGGGEATAIAIELL